MKILEILGVHGCYLRYELEIYICVADRQSFSSKSYELEIYISVADRQSFSSKSYELEIQGDPEKIGISHFFIAFSIFLDDCQLYHVNKKLFLFRRFSEIHRAQ